MAATLENLKFECWQILSVVKLKFPNQKHMNTVKLLSISHIYNEMPLGLHLLHIMKRLSIGRHIEI